MNEAQVMKTIKMMPVEEKIAQLSQTDKAYVRDYIDRAAEKIHKQIWTAGVAANGNIFKIT